jgi:hypothetical protein
VSAADFFLFAECLLEPGFDGLLITFLVLMDVFTFEATFLETLPDEDEFCCSCVGYGYCTTRAVNLVDFMPSPTALILNFLMELVVDSPFFRPFMTKLLKLLLIVLMSFEPFCAFKIALLFYVKSLGLTMLFLVLIYDC